LRRGKESVSEANDRDVAGRGSARRDRLWQVRPFEAWRSLRLLAVCGLLVLAVGLIFAQTGHHEFVNQDDPEYVFNNPHVSRGLGSDGIVWAFTHNHAANWHPLTSMSHMLDCQLFRLNAGAHHLTGVPLHAATTVILFLLLGRMTGRFWPSALVAALFAVHPLRVESVAWVSERKDVLSGLLFVLTLAAYLGYVRHRFSLTRYSVVIFFAGLGLMAKPMLVTLPFVLLLLDYWPLGRMTSPGKPPAASPEAGGFSFPLMLLVEKLPLLLLAIASSVLTIWAQSKAIVGTDKFAIVWRVANAVVSCGVYLGQLFWPVNLAAHYPHLHADLPFASVAVAALVLLGFSVLALMGWRRCPHLLVGWLWYLGMLVPVIGLVQVGMQARADRYTYLPQIGLYIALAWVAADFRPSWLRRRGGGVFAALALALLTAGAWRQTTFWHDSESLWRHTLACTTPSSVAHFNLGAAVASQGRLDEAIAEYRKALAIKPDLVAALNNLGVALAQQHRLDEAVPRLRQAVRIDPAFASAHYNLGMALHDAKDAVGAIAEFQKAVDWKPDYVAAHHQLGALLEEQGKIADAIAHYRKAVEIGSDNADIYSSLAWLLATSSATSLRNAAEAVEHAQRANRLSGGRQPVILDTLAAAYAAAGRFPEALTAARQALELAGQQSDKVLIDGLRSRIALYEASRPFHKAQPSPAGRP
jgi:tetratricopeptide (TPR) repeat protein